MEESPPTMLEDLPPEVFALIALKLDVPSLGRLACVSAALRGSLDDQHEAWDAQWAKETSRALLPSNVMAHDALRSLATLADVQWERMSSPPTETGPSWRDYACLLHHDGKVILFAGRSHTAASEVQYFNDAWAFDTKEMTWYQVAVNSKRQPRPRCFNSDGGGGGCVIRGHGKHWAVFFGGKRVEGYRDSETWLLGPLDEPREQWSWVAVKSDLDFGLEPQARFHHTLTVVPRTEAEGEDGFDFVFMIGGHNRTISPILDTHAFSLRDASFEWLSDVLRHPIDDCDDQRVTASASWVAQPREPEPSPRGFHCATFWRPREGDPGFIVVACGLGISADIVDDDDDTVDDDYCALGDAHLFSCADSQWTPLEAKLPEPRSRAAASIVRDHLVICGGCRASANPRYPLAPGAPYNDVWLLKLSVPQGAQVWERCSLPSDRVPTTVPRTQAVAHSVFGGSALLLLGGCDPTRRPEATDNFGDTHTAQAWALHESVALSFVGRTSSTARGFNRPCAASLCTAGMPLTYAGRRLFSKESQMWNGKPSARMLVHGLSNAQELNGAVGTLVDPSAHDESADARVGVKLGPPHNKAVKVRRRNLWPSEAAFRQPLFALPDAWVDDDASFFALLPAIDWAQVPDSFTVTQAIAGNTRVVVARLSLLSDTSAAARGSGDQVESAADDHVVDQLEGESEAELPELK